MRKNKNNTVNFKFALNFCAIIVATYIVIVVTLFFLMGEQLKYRNSRGNIEMLPATSGSVELVQDSLVEQHFVAKIDRITAVSVMWGTYFRPNAGTAVVELYRTDINELLANQSFNVTEITEGSITKIDLKKPLLNLWNVPLKIKITANSQVGHAVSPMVNYNPEKRTEENFQLFLNSGKIDGTLCFSVSGEDNIWIGRHYWKASIMFGFVLIGVLAYFLIRIKKGKHSLIVTSFFAVKHYKFLIQQLVLRDFKSKYKRSFLGIIWSFLNPLLTSLVIYTVFSNIFRFDVEYYTVYLISGVVLFNFFSECCGMCLTSIVGNASLITKVYVPKYVYPMTRTLSSGINLVLAFIPVIIIALISGLLPTKSWVLIIFPLICLMLFCYGIGMLFSSAMVFFRDTQFLWGIVSMVWMYLTPIFYPASILPDNLKWLLNVNPLYYYIGFVRTCLIDGISPEPIVYVQCVLFSIGMVIIGGLVFKKTQDKFVLHL